MATRVLTGWTLRHQSRRNLTIIPFSRSGGIPSGIVAPKSSHRGIINGNYAPPNPSNNLDSKELDIPPLDLLSALNVSPVEKNEEAISSSSNTPFKTQPDGGTTPGAFIETSGRNAMDIPPLDLLSAIPSNKSKEVTPSPPEQKHHGKAAIYLEEIAYIERKLRSKNNLTKTHVSRLKSQLKIKRNALNRLKVNISTVDKGEESRRAKNRKRQERRQRARRMLRESAALDDDVNKLFEDRQTNSSVSSHSESRGSRRRREYADVSDGGRNEAYEMRQTKSYILPRPKASPRGVLIPNFDSDIIQTQANGTILASSGTTSILSTVILVPPETEANVEKKSFEQTVMDCIQQRNAQNGSLFLPLQVEYRERWHASGKIPTHNQRRRDNSGPLSEREVLASRAIDRTLRPWLMKGLGEYSLKGEVFNGSFLPENIVVNCQVQSYDTRSSTLGQHRTHADPTALAINAAIATIYQSAYSENATKLPVPLDAAACIKLAMRRDGNVIYDPTPAEAEECAFELLFAGTRDHILMIEFSAKGESYSVDDMRDKYNVDPGISEDIVADALRLAKEAILPIIHYQEDLRSKYLEGQDLSKSSGEITWSDEDLARTLGLSTNSESGTVVVYDSPAFNSQDSAQFLDDAFAFILSKLEMAALKSFGYDGQSENEPSNSLAYIHNGDMLSKKLRGRRETMIQNEVTRLLIDEFEPQNPDVAASYRAALSAGSNSVFINTVRDHIHERLMQYGFGDAALKGFRSDGRSPNAVRPVSAAAPIFPDCVHGSSIFSRGETQVLSTATLSAPSDGMPIINPFAPSMWNTDDTSNDKDDEKIPVGSLRFLRSQAKLESDMNSRRVKAGREMTGDSGILSEVKRGFLHYDFPDFCIGNIKSKAGGAANRRAIGHGNLAERAILPVIPKPDDFPYSIRLTCEVTSSNGSSSMASACAASLSMLDAGIPLTAPVAGVSVGLTNSQMLLLDITGTEDHFGNMDCKVCGTFGGITAIQCDVKTPVDVKIITDALNLAKHGRHAILREMDHSCKKTLGGLIPRSTMKSTAPRVEVISYDPNRKRDLIGPGGSVLRQLEDRFNVTLDLSQDGRCLIFGGVDSVKEAASVILDLVGEVEVGGIYEGTVIEIKDFGAVIELLRNKEGLLHVSEITDDLKGKHPGGNMGLVNEYLKIGEKIQVLCTKIDHVQGSIKLSRKQLLRQQKYLQDSEGQKYQDLEFNNIEIDNLLDKTHHPKTKFAEDKLTRSNDGNDGDEEYDNQEYGSDEEYNDAEYDRGEDEGDINYDMKEEHLESLTVPKLQEQLRALGLTVSGTKAVLIRRLLEHLEYSSEDEYKEEADYVRGEDEGDINYDMKEGHLESLTVPQLQDQLRALGLTVSGTKAVLIRRLLEHLEYSSEEESDDKEYDRNQDDVNYDMKEEHLESLTVPQLQDQLRALGLTVSGTKAVLIKRLLEHIEYLEFLTVPKLQEQLLTRGLPMSGTKSMMIKRLLGHTEEQ